MFFACVLYSLQLCHFCAGVASLTSKIRISDSSTGMNHVYTLYVI